MNPIEELGSFGEIPVTIRVDLTCYPLTLASILDLEEGSVIRTARSAGDNVDIQIAGRLVGYGEIVSIEGSRGVRITNLKEGH